MESFVACTYIRGAYVDGVVRRAHVSGVDPPYTCKGAIRGWSRSSRACIKVAFVALWVDFRVGLRRSLQGSGVDFKL